MITTNIKYIEEENYKINEIKKEAYKNIKYMLLNIITQKDFLTGAPPR